MILYSDREIEIYSMLSQLQQRFCQWLIVLVAWNAHAYSMGYCLDVLAWELSYDIMLPTNEGIYLASHFSFTLAAVMGLVITVGTWPLLRWWQLTGIILLAVVLSWILTCGWIALSLYFPSWLEPLPSQTLASPRRYIVIMSFRRVMPYCLTISAMLSLLLSLYNRSKK
jgi:hypothetical protein